MSAKQSKMVSNQKTKPVTNRDELSRELSMLHASGTPWRKISKKYNDVPGGTLCRIANSDYDPKTPKIRKALHLPPLHLTPACPECGIVHVSKTCPKSRKEKEYEHLSDISTKRLAELIRNRREIK